MEYFHLRLDRSEFSAQQAYDGLLNGKLKGVVGSQRD